MPFDVEPQSGAKEVGATIYADQDVATEQVAITFDA